jgi:hypothetical protein
MAWNAARKRFVAALALFLIWVAALAVLAAVSAYRPAARSAAQPEQPAAIKLPEAETGSEAE